MQLLKVFVGRKLTEVASFWKSHNVLGCREVSRRKVSEIENFVRKKGERSRQAKQWSQKERKKGKTKECSKVQIVATKINAGLGIYQLRSSRAHIPSPVVASQF